MRLDQGTCLFLAAMLAPAPDEAPVFVAAPDAEADAEPDATTEDGSESGGGRAFPAQTPVQEHSGLASSSAL